MYAWNECIKSIDIVYIIITLYRVKSKKKKKRASSRKKKKSSRRRRARAVSMEKKKIRTVTNNIIMAWADKCGCVDFTNWATVASAGKHLKSAWAIGARRVIFCGQIARETLRRTTQRDPLANVVQRPRETERSRVTSADREPSLPVKYCDDDMREANLPHDVVVKRFCIDSKTLRFATEEKVGIFSEWWNVFTIFRTGREEIHINILLVC